MKPKNTTSVKHWRAEKAEGFSITAIQSSSNAMADTAILRSSAPLARFPPCRLLVLSWSLLSFPCPSVPLLHKSKPPCLKKGNSPSSLNYLGIIPKMVVYGDTRLYASLRNLSEVVPCVGNRGDKTLGVICYSISIILERASRYVNILDS